jgi:lambda repressor-like predicted transcriptional regulator
MSAVALKLICSSSKSGESLSQISELTGLSIDQVKETLGQATGITLEDLSIIFHMKQRGHSLEQISQRSGVELQVLEQFLPQEDPQVIKGFEAQIEGVNERAVLAYTLGSSDEGVSLTTKASEAAPVYLRTPPTEEAKQTPQPTQNLSTPLPSYTAANASPTSCTGSISSLENSPSMKCLITCSRSTVAGVSCLEEVYSSLAVVFLQ